MACFLGSRLRFGIPVVAGISGMFTIKHTFSEENDKPKGKFYGKTIVITGAGGTFGSIGANHFLGQGANVVLVDVDQAALNFALKKLKEIEPDKVRCCSCDVRDYQAVENAINKAIVPFGGKIDMLWNNAGIQGQMKPLLEYPSSDVEAVMGVNVLGSFNVLQIVGRNMVKHGGGTIVQTGSVAALRGTPTMSAYVASKAAIHGLTMTAAKDLAPYNIRVNTVLPALIGPEDGFMWKRQNELHAASQSPYFSRIEADVAKNKINGVPMKRLGTVEEVVSAVSYLLSDESSYITGTSLVVAGGMA